MRCDTVAILQHTLKSFPALPNLLESIADKAELLRTVETYSNVNRAVN